MEDISKVIVEDISSRENEPKELIVEEKKKFLHLIHALSPINERYAHFQFTVVRKDGSAEKFYTFENGIIEMQGNCYNIKGRFEHKDYPFVEIASYHNHINKKFKLIQHKNNNPTKKWMNLFVRINDGYVWTLDGLNQADIAFNSFIENLYAKIDNGLNSELAYSFLNQLYQTLSDLGRKNMIGTDTEDLEDIGEFTNLVMDEIGFGNEELESKIWFSHDWY